MERIMNRWNTRIWIGAGLVLLGVLMLVQRIGLLGAFSGLPVAALFLLGAGFFLYRFFMNSRTEWWAAIPGFALFGIAVTILLSDVLPGWSGFWFLASLGVGFLCVYLSGHERWWALIPAGILVTLGFVAVVSDAFGGNGSAAVLFVGMGLTFILVAVLTGMQWGWIPGIILLIMGGIFGAPSFGSMNLLLPAALILGGVLLIIQFVRKK